MASACGSPSLQAVEEAEGVGRGEESEAGRVQPLAGRSSDPNQAPHGATSGSR
jgi:hypothetical protein